MTVGILTPLSRDLAATHLVFAGMVAALLLLGMRLDSLPFISRIAVNVGFLLIILHFGPTWWNRNSPLWPSHTYMRVRGRLDVVKALRRHAHGDRQTQVDIHTEAMLMAKRIESERIEGDGTGLIAGLESRPTGPVSMARRSRAFAKRRTMPCAT